MNKEKILKMSRNSNNDEGMEYAENQGRKIGFFVFASLFVFIAIFSLFFGQQSTLFATSSLFWAFLAAEAYAKYRFTTKKVFLASAVTACIASGCFIANYIITTVR